MWRRTEVAAAAPSAGERRARGCLGRHRRWRDGVGDAERRPIGEEEEGARRGVGGCGGWWWIEGGAGVERWSTGRDRGEWLERRSVCRGKESRRRGLGRGGEVASGAALENVGAGESSPEESRGRGSSLRGKAATAGHGWRRARGGAAPGARLGAARLRSCSAGKARAGLGGRGAV